jgi:tRNA (uracil-5-)-methyltransferase
MECEYVGVCGSCNLGHLTYDEQLEYKLNIETTRFSSLYNNKIDIIRSEESSFRNRAEFRIWKIYDEENNFTLNYAMNSVEKTILPISKCDIVSSIISKTMPKLLNAISKIELLHSKFFSIEFLSSNTNDLLVTLVYHKKLSQEWINEASKIKNSFNIKIIGRSRKQKVVISDDFINESLLINKNKFDFLYFENGFTQPNQKVNEQMIQWVIQNIIQGDDLCELYCGGGNFTIPLSKCFTKVLATEISKTSIKSAKINCELNTINNIKFIRMSSEDFVKALNKDREFTRLKKEKINLDDYNFQTIFVDPPRAGLDDTTRNLSQNFQQIIYISCNPETLYRDLDILCQTHSIQKFALFDQFAYTKHIECGVILTKI